MAYDGLVNYTIVHELKSKIINGKIDKIFEPNFDEIILGIYSNGIKYALNLVIHPQYYRTNLTTNIKPNPQQAPNFCMSLRKYLVGSHITNIYTNNLERIVFIEFEGYNKSKDFSTKKLVIELMGKHSNIILLDSNNTIIESFKHFSTNSGSYRDIFAGAKYILPKSDKLDFIDISDEGEFFRVLENNSKKLTSNSLTNVISRTFTGISKPSIQSFEYFLNITDEINKENAFKLFNYIQNIIKRNLDIKCTNHKENYALLVPKLSNFSYLESEVPDLQVNFFLDDYYTDKENETTFINYRNSILKLILNRLEKLKSKLENVNSKIAECKDAEKYRLYGELITSNLYRIKDYNVPSITLENYYDNNNSIIIDLDESITPSANAKKFFKKYKKLKTAKDFVDLQKDSIVNDIKYFEDIVYKIEQCKNIFELDKIYDDIEKANIISHNKKNQKKDSISSPNTSEPLKFEIDGFVVLVGKNSKQNDYLTTKIANKDDIWFHVKDFHGSHVILKTENKTPTQETINKCASLAKKYSKASQSSNITVDYALVKYVKKLSGSRPGMVIYTNNQSVIVP